MNKSVKEPTDDKIKMEIVILLFTHKVAALTFSSNVAFSQLAHAISQPTIMSWMKFYVNLSPDCYNTMPVAFRIVGSILTFIV